MFGHTINHQKRDLKNRKLFNAIAAGDLERVKVALNEGAQLDASHYFNSPLVDAFVGPSLDVFKYLLACKANPNFVFANGTTLLGDAVLNGRSPERVGLLLEYGANANQPNKEGVTPLQIALGMPNAAMLIVLLDSGVKLNWQDKKNLWPTQKEKLFCHLRWRIDFYIKRLVQSIENNDKTIKYIGILNKLTKNIEGSASILPGPLGRFDVDNLKEVRSQRRKWLVNGIGNAIVNLHELESLQNAKVSLQTIMDNLKIIKGLGSVGFTKKASMAELEACMKELNKRIAHAKQQTEIDASIQASSFVIIDSLAPVSEVVDDAELHVPEEALLAAVDKGDVEEVERLILTGINPNFQGPFHTPLTSAASKNRESVVEKLINLGANIDWDALSKTKSMKTCVVRVLTKMIFQDIDDLFQFKYEPNNHLALINQKTAHFVSSEFKDERAGVRKYFVSRINEKRKELASVIDVVILKAVRDRFSLIEQTMAIIQSPEGEKEKDSMKQLRQWINRLNGRIAKLEGEEKTKYQPGLTQFASVEPAAVDKRSELGPDAGYTL